MSIQLVLKYLGSNKLLKVLTPLLITVLLHGCSLESAEENPQSEIIRDSEGKIVSGEVTKHFKNGKVAEIINVKNYKLDGRAVKFYEDGITKRSELFYAHGLLEGVQKRFYKTGALYKEEKYVNNKRQGLTSKYREGGKLMSEAYFKNGFAGDNLVEYLTDGSRKKKYPKIIIKEEDRLDLDGSVIINVFLSDNSKNVEFFLGQLDEEGFLNDKLDLQYTSNKGVLTFTIMLQAGERAQGEYHIVAKVITRLNNVYITTRKHSVRIRTKPA